MLATSQKLFLRMFGAYRNQDTHPVQTTNIEATITTDLQSLSHDNGENIALVVYQAFIGLTVHWNAGRVLARAREVPSSGIRFVSAEDDYIYLG